MFSKSKSVPQLLVNQLDGFKISRRPHNILACRGHYIAKKFAILNYAEMLLARKVWDISQSFLSGDLASFSVIVMYSTFTYINLPKSMT